MRRESLQRLIVSVLTPLMRRDPSVQVAESEVRVKPQVEPRQESRDPLIGEQIEQRCVGFVDGE